MSATEDLSLRQHDTTSEDDATAEVGGVRTGRASNSAARQSDDGVMSF